MPCEFCSLVPIYNISVCINVIIIIITFFKNLKRWQNNPYFCLFFLFCGDFVLSCLLNEKKLFYWTQSAFFPLKIKYYMIGQKMQDGRCTWLIISLNQFLFSLKIRKSFIKWHPLSTMHVFPFSKYVCIFCALYIYHLLYF